MPTCPVDARWLAGHDKDLEHARVLLLDAIALLSYKSNADFVQTRGRVTLALAKLRAADDALIAAQIPW